MTTLGSFGDQESFSVLGDYQFRLNMIAREVELCKAALEEWKLSKHQTHTACRLVGDLERGVEELAATVACHLQGETEKTRPGAIDRQLENVCILCDELMSIIFHQPQVNPLPA